MARLRFRRTTPRRRLVAGLGALSVAVLAAAAPAAAQGSGKGYLLATPVGSLSLRVGYDRALAGSDVFREASRLLTVEKSDFGGVSGALDLGVRVNDRFDVVLGAAYAGSSVTSEYRGYVDNDDLPIEQTTQLQRVPVSLSLKGYLAPRGRSIGRFAWIPNRFSPYAGGGGGMLWHRFRQQGDFVDFNTQNLRVFTSTFESDKWTTQLHAFTGVDVSLSPRTALTAEARYTWARAPLSREYFTGFERIDLSGVAATAGLSFRF
jgi:hypothetical protein